MEVFALVAVLFLLWIFFLVTVKQMYYMIRYRKEYMACTNFVLNNVQDLDAMFSLNRRHHHYIVKYDFILASTRGQISECGYRYYIVRKNRNRAIYS